MTNKDILDLIEYCSSHAREFNAWPTDFETDSGTVLGQGQYMPILYVRVPQTVEALWCLIEKGE